MICEGIYWNIKVVYVSYVNHILKQFPFSFFFFLIEKQHLKYDQCGLI